MTRSPILVTGGTGFIGAHVTRALVSRGESPRCLVRPRSNPRNLAGLPVELVTGDLGDRESLVRAMAGVRTVYHCAADYRLYARHPREIYAANVDGTENVMSTASAAGVSRVVYTSSVGALGLCAEGPADERTPVSLRDMAGHYKRSKYLAEHVALRWAGNGLGVVIVNPATPVGECDVKPTPTGDMILRFLKRRMPAYVDTGLNVVDVRDVAEAHVLAAEKGRVGERYILGCRNMTLKEILDVLATITGLRAPRLRLPHWVPIGIAAVDTAWARMWGRIPSVPLEGARMSSRRMFFDSTKAVRDLGMPQGSVEEALARAVSWFRSEGYVGA